MVATTKEKEDTACSSFIANGCRATKEKKETAPSMTANTLLNPADVSNSIFLEAEDSKLIFCYVVCCPHTKQYMQPVDVLLPLVFSAPTTYILLPISLCTSQSHFYVLMICLPSILFSSIESQLITKTT